jgi:hypothetical protein
MMLVILTPIRATAGSLERARDGVRQLSAELDMSLGPHGLAHSGPGAHAGGNESPGPEGEFARLRQTRIIHYMSFFVLAPDGEAQKYVGLEVNADGSLRELHRLMASCPAILRKLFAECDAFDPKWDERGLRRFLARYTERPNAVYKAFPGRSLAQILDERDLRIDARERFEAIASNTSPPVEPRTRAAARIASRESPSSASSIWERLRQGFAGEGLVRYGSTRPWYVRWSLDMGGWRDEVNLWGNRIFTVLLFVSAVIGFCTSARDHRHALCIAAIGFGIAAAAVSMAWLRYRPRNLSRDGGLPVVGGFLWSALADGAVSAAWFVAAALVGRLALTHTSVAVALVVFAAMAFQMRQAGVRLEVSGALLLLLVDIAVRDPLYMLSVLVALIGVVPLLFAGAFLYVMDGLLTAVLGTATLAVGWVALSRYCRAVPIELAAWGGVSIAVLSIVAGLRLMCWLFMVRRAEEKDNAREEANENAAELAPLRIAEHLAEVDMGEDWQLQNHLVILSELKKGALRIRTLRRVLRAVSLFAKVYANRGDLGGIRTIHFAHFIVLEKMNPKRLLFLSNYDSGFGSYLQEFNRVLGVTAVWSNCVGFPPAFGLVGDGARDEQRFRQFGRRDQVPTLGWYAAYPELFVADIETATTTRENLRRRLDDPSTWWRRMRARFGKPLSEADCDASLQRL